MKVTPVPGCRACWGTGIVSDWVDWGSTTVPLPTICDCVTDQVEDENEEIEIVPVEALDDPFEELDYEQEHEFLEMMVESEFSKTLPHSAWWDLCPSAFS